MAELNTGWSTGFEQGMRLQQLRSQEAIRRVQERRTVAELEMKLQQHQMEIDMQAAVAKAGAEFQMLTDPSNPNAVLPGTALLLTAGKLARNPIELANIGVKAVELNNKGTIDASEQALIDQRKASADLSRARISELEKGAGGTQPEWVNSITFLEDRLGTKLPATQIEEMWRVKSGLLPKAGTLTIPSEAAYVDDHLDKVMEQATIEETITTRNLLGRESSETRRRRPRGREEAREYLRKEYQDIYGRPQSAAPAATATPPAAAPAPADTTPAAQPEMQPATQLKVGDIVKGYRYNGQFPPSDRRAWDKVTQ